MSGHTPGPWDVDPASADEGGCSIISKNGTVAWHVHYDNAWLIAAAPDLLEALRHLLSNSGYSYMSDADLQEHQRLGNGDMPAIIAARAAIAKATQP